MELRDNMETTATFKNKKTGEVRQFTLEEAQSVGISEKVFLEKLKASKEIKELSETGTKKTEDQLSNLESLASEIIGLTETGKNVSGRYTGGAKENIAGVRELLGIKRQGLGGEFVGNVDKTRA